MEEETLRTYYAHLLEHLVFPFEADHTWETDSFTSKTIRDKDTEKMANGANRAVFEEATRAEVLKDFAIRAVDADGNDIPLKARAVYLC
jgi:hypothetical protein